MDTLTELEDALGADMRGHHRQALAAGLALAIDELARQQRLPQSPRAFAALTRQRTACLAALRVIDTVWQRLHRAGVQLRP